MLIGLNASAQATSDAGLLTPDGGLYIGAYVGGHFVLDDWDLSEVEDAGIAIDHGADVGLRVGFHPTWWIAAEIGVGLLPLRAADELNIAVTTTADLLFLTYRGRWVPFIDIGIGGYHQVDGPLGTDNDLNLHYGVGLKGMLTERWVLRVDVRHVVTDGFDEQQGGRRVANNLIVNVGADWFATLSPPDEDYDGVSDALDDCPEVAGPESARGCPDYDGDGVADVSDTCPKVPGLPGLAGCPDSDCDGVKDATDRCPNIPGHRSAVGCPDRDGDTIVDSADRCPDRPGSRARFGCPGAQDADGDGIDDAVDACPNIHGAQTAAGCPDTDRDGTTDAQDKCPKDLGPKAEDGCPDSDGDGLRNDVDRCPYVVGKKENTGCPPELDRWTQGISFPSRRATILSRSLPILNEAVRYLTAHPAVRLRIEGHTDEMGAPAYNLQLSRRRANAVRDYLVSKGIPAARLQVQAHGGTRPRASNKSAQGRAQNRRIEFELLGAE